MTWREVTVWYVDNVNPEVYRWGLSACPVDGGMYEIQHTNKPKIDGALTVTMIPFNRIHRVDVRYLESEDISDG